jgi:hypothetical protein
VSRGKQHSTRFGRTRTRDERLDTKAAVPDGPIGAAQTTASEEKELCG